MTYNEWYNQVIKVAQEFGTVEKEYHTLLHKFKHDEKVEVGRSSKEMDYALLPETMYPEVLKIHTKFKHVYDQMHDLQYVSIITNKTPQGALLYLSIPEEMVIEFYKMKYNMAEYLDVFKLRGYGNKNKNDCRRMET